MKWVVVVAAALAKQRLWLLLGVNLVLAGTRAGLEEESE